jgi:hypothetical protein
MLLQVLVKLLALCLAAHCYFGGVVPVYRHVGYWLDRCFVSQPDYVNFGGVPPHTDP